MKRSCGLATAVSGGKLCYKSVVLGHDGKRQEMTNHQLVDVGGCSR